MKYFYLILILSTNIFAKNIIIVDIMDTIVDQNLLRNKIKNNNKKYKYFPLVEILNNIDQEIYYVSSISKSVYDIEKKIKEGILPSGNVCQSDSLLSSLIIFDQYFDYTISQNYIFKYNCLNKVLLKNVGNKITFIHNSSYFSQYIFEKSISYSKIKNYTRYIRDLSLENTLFKKSETLEKTIYFISDNVLSKKFRLDKQYHLNIGSYMNNCIKHYKYKLKLEYDIDQANVDYQCQKIIQMYIERETQNE